jgi:hypothetical protein
MILKCYGNVQLTPKSKVKTKPKFWDGPLVVFLNLVHSDSSPIILSLIWGTGLCEVTFIYGYACLLSQVLICTLKL